MNRSPRAAVLGGVVVAGLMLLGTTAGAQGNGSIYTQCPGTRTATGSRTARSRAIPTSSACTRRGRRFRHHGGREADLHVRVLRRHRPLPSQVVNGNGIRPGGLAAANYPAPTIHLKEGQEFYLSLTNVGMILRPDLFDPHSVHFHGFPQAASVFDGVPESSATINMGSTFTYYYNIVDGLAGTYMYHCHVEATEHIQMGMVGNLYIDPRQNDCGTPANPTACPAGHHAGLRYVYNDGDGSTAFDVEYPIQLGGVDANFHDQHIAIQPLPFAAMDDKYAILNGRGYPDTVNADAIITDAGFGSLPSQPVHSKIEATAGERVLLRLSNLAVTRFFTLGSTIPMHVVGHNAKLLRGPLGAEPLLRHQLRDPRRRRVRRRHPEHRGPLRGHVPPLHHEPQLPQQ